MSVLESPYAVLQKSGIPLPVCMCMQGKGLQLGDAQWTARQKNDKSTKAISASEHTPY